MQNTTITTDLSHYTVILVKRLNPFSRTSIQQSRSTPFLSKGRKASPLLFLLNKLLHSSHLGHAPVLGLPGVKVHESSKRLAKDGERDPEDDVAQQLAVGRRLLLQGFRELDERQLEEHAEESDAYDVCVS